LTDYKTSALLFTDCKTSIWLLTDFSCDYWITSFAFNSGKLGENFIFCLGSYFLNKGLGSFICLGFKYLRMNVENFWLFSIRRRCNSNFASSYFLLSSSLIQTSLWNLEATGGCQSGLSNSGLLFTTFSCIRSNASLRIFLKSMAGFCFCYSSFSNFLAFFFSKRILIRSIFWKSGSSAK